MSADLVVIWSDEWEGYWRPNAAGYTSWLSAAGVYTRTEAEERTGHCGPEKGIEIRPLDGEIARAAKPGTVMTEVLGRQHLDPEVFVESLQSRDGGLDLVVRSVVFPVLVEILARVTLDQAAENYLEMRGEHPALGAVTVRVQRHEGLTPHQARERAEAETAAAGQLMENLTQAIRSRLPRFMGPDVLNAVHAAERWLRD